MYWKWTLRREAQGQKRMWGKRRAAAKPKATEEAEMNAPAAAGLVEIHGSTADSGFELELARGRRLRVPATFDSAGLRRLLEVLEGS